MLELCRESLAQQIRRNGPLDARQTVRVGIKIAGALETAHRSGFLHRDMKPQNILITQFDEPALADFGVAALQASAQATAGVLGFTTVHAAPEILEGHELSPATDIYGLASSLYQLLTGLAPFAAFENEAPAAVILRILRDPVRPVRSNAVPLELSDLLEAALAKDPRNRPPPPLDSPKRCGTSRKRARGRKRRMWRGEPSGLVGNRTGWRHRRRSGSRPNSRPRRPFRPLPLPCREPRHRSRRRPLRWGRRPRQFSRRGPRCGRCRSRPCRLPPSHQARFLPNHRRP